MNWNLTVDQIAFLGGRAVLWLILGAFLIARAHADPSCKELDAPLNGAAYHAPNSAAGGRPTNSGLEVSGFVKSSGAVSVNGIDVSKYQDFTDFVQAKACGANFAYIRVSAGTLSDNEPQYNVNWTGARYAGLLIGPYHSFVFQDASGAFQGQSPSDQQNLTTTNFAMADYQAQLFLNRLHQLIDESPTLSAAGANAASNEMLPIAIGVMAQPQLGHSAADQQMIGALYVSSVCRWIQYIKNHDPVFGKFEFVMEISPSIYARYGFGTQQSDPCSFKTMPLWVYLPTKHADRQDVDADPGTIALVHAMCLTRSGDRCILQTYTSFGGFAIFGKQAGPGLDLDRFYGSQSDLQAKLKPTG